MDVILSEDVSHDRIVAQYRLPFTFQFVADLPLLRARPPLAGIKRTRHQMEEELDERSPEVDHRNVRRRFDEPSQRDTDSERVSHPMPILNPWSTTQGSQHRDNSPSTPSVPQPPQVAPINNADPQGKLWLCSMEPELM